MITYFLSKNKQNKLSIIHHLLHKNKLELSSIAAALSVSTAQTRRYIDELNADTQSFDKNFFLKKEGDSIQFSQTDTLSNYKMYRALSIYYLHQSYSFEICLLLATHHSLTLDALCKKLAISNSHGYKELQKVKSILKKFNLEVTKDKNAVLKLSGDELYVRIFTFNFIHSCTSVDEWCFPSTSKLEIQKAFSSVLPDLSVTDVKQHKLFIFLAILQSRLKQGHYFSQKNPRIIHDNLEILKVFSYSSVIDYYEKHQLFNPEIQQTEYSCLTLFFRLFFPELIGEDNFSIVGEQLQRTKDPSMLFLTNLLNQWEKQFPVDVPVKNKYNFSYYFFLFYTAVIELNTKTIQLWPDDSVQQAKNLIFDTVTFDKIKQFITSMIDEDTVLSPSDKKKLYAERTYLSYMFLLRTRIFQKKTVTIYTFFDDDYTLNSFLKAFLTKIYKDNLIQFTNKVEEATIIVTDQLDFNPDTAKEIIILNTPYHKAACDHIVQSINHYLLNY